MRTDLKPLERVQADLLLSTARQLGTVRAAARAVGVRYGTILGYWRRWGLTDDFPLTRGGRPGQPPASNEAQNVTSPDFE